MKKVVDVENMFYQRCGFSSLDIFCSEHFSNFNFLVGGSRTSPSSSLTVLHTAGGLLDDDSDGVFKNQMEETNNNLRIISLHVSVRQKVMTQNNQFQ